MRFGTWTELILPAGHAPPADRRAAVLRATESAPTGPGAFQLRLRDDLIDYPAGKSAMVAYGGGPDARAALRDLLLSPVGARAIALGPLLCRFADGQGAAAGIAVERRRFAERFGGPPAAEDAAQGG